MSERSRFILKQALELDPDERADVAAQLLGSLDPPPDAAVDLLWQEEIARRLAAYKEGKIAVLSLDEVRERLRRVTD